jgi:hypothetical protein
MIDKQFQFPDPKILKTKLIKKSALLKWRRDNGCPTQVIDQHFAEKLPPIQPKDIEGWKKFSQD